MGELKVKISDETEKNFREAAMHEFGFQKGSLSNAAEKALSSWTTRHRNIDKLRLAAKQKIKDPVGSMRGIMKHVKKNSVELQHDAYNIRSNRWKKRVH